MLISARRRRDKHPSAMLVRAPSRPYASYAHKSDSVGMDDRALAMRARMNAAAGSP
jgi:hypothetical protein